MNVVHVVNNDRSANVGIGTLVGMSGSPLTVSLDEDFSDKPSAVRCFVWEIVVLALSKACRPTCQHIAGIRGTQGGSSAGHDNRHVPATSGGS